MQRQRALSSKKQEGKPRNDAGSKRDVHAHTHGDDPYKLLPKNSNNNNSNKKKKTQERQRRTQKIKNSFRTQRTKAKNMLLETPVELNNGKKKIA